MEKTTGCRVCRGTFTDEELEGHSSCPGCGTKVLPVDLKEEVSLQINWGDLRTLCMWASWWASLKFPESDSETAIKNVVASLEAQRPEEYSALSLEKEIQELAVSLRKEGSIRGAVELFQNGKKKKL